VVQARSTGAFTALARVWTGRMIETLGLTKRYGRTVAVKDLTMQVSPGLVTGFLGPNGAGKSTTMRLIVGLDRPTAGSVTVNGRPYAEHRNPARQVGALLDARARDPRLTARSYLRAAAATHGIADTRVDELLELTGLSSVARRAVGAFSLGMTQRLGMATALLGDPQTLILDEPINGLDPEGVLWIRLLLRQQADLGKTVFVSSHLMSEVALFADDLVILGRGRLLLQESMSAFIANSSTRAIRVRSVQAEEIAEALRGQPVGVAWLGPGVLRIDGIGADEMGALALKRGWTLGELAPLTASLEEAYMRLTETAVEYHSQRPATVARRVTL